MFEAYLFIILLLPIFIATLNTRIKVKLNGRYTYNVFKRFFVSFFIINICIGFPIWVVGRVVISFL